MRWKSELDQMSCFRHGEGMGSLCPGDAACISYLSWVHSINSCQSVTESCSVIAGTYHLYVMLVRVSSYSQICRNACTCSIQSFFTVNRIMLHLCSYRSKQGLTIYRCSVIFHK